MLPWEVREVREVRGSAGSGLTCFEKNGLASSRRFFVALSMELRNHSYVCVFSVSVKKRLLSVAAGFRSEDKLSKPY